MWKVLHKDPPYFTMFLEENKDSYHIGVTNFQQHWSNNTSRSNLLHELKQSNEGIEFDDENELLKRGLDMLKNPESLKSVRISHKEEDEKLNVLMTKSFEILNELMTKSFEITIRLDLCLLKGSPQSLFEMVVQPLLQTICDLRSSQNELRQLLLKKDREIEEYKIEGKAPRRLITTVYNDAEHMMRHTTYDELFSAPDVPDFLKMIADKCNLERKTPLLLPSASNSSTSSTLMTGVNTSKATDSTAVIKTEPSSQNSINKLSENTVTTIPSIENVTNVISSENVSNISIEKVKSEYTETIPTMEKPTHNSINEETNSVSLSNKETMQKDIEVKLYPKVEVKQSEESPAKKRHRKLLNY